MFIVLRKTQNKKRFEKNLEENEENQKNPENYENVTIEAKQILNQVKGGIKGHQQVRSQKIREK